MTRHLSRQGIPRKVARHCSLARRLAKQLAKELGITVLNDVVLNQVVVRCSLGVSHHVDDVLTQRGIERVQADAVCFIGGALWKDRRKRPSTHGQSAAICRPREARHEDHHCTHAV